MAICSFRVGALPAIFFFLIAADSHASRMLILPPLEATTYHDFRFGVWESPTGPSTHQTLTYTPGSTPIRAGFIFFISLVNIGGIEQTGTIKMDFTTYNGSSFTTRVGLCGPALSGISDKSDTTSGSGSVSFNWKIPACSPATNANGCKNSFAAYAMFEGTYASTLASLTFTTLIKLTVDNDRGAILGTLNRNLPLTTTWTLCNGVLVTTSSRNYGYYLNQSGIETIMLNGGRPF
mgnify:FL=1